MLATDNNTNLMCDAVKYRTFSAALLEESVKSGASYLRWWCTISNNRLKLVKAAMLTYNTGNSGEKTSLPLVVSCNDTSFDNASWSSNELSMALVKIEKLANTHHISTLFKLWGGVVAVI